MPRRSAAPQRRASLETNFKEETRNAISLVSGGCSCEALRVSCESRLRNLGGSGYQPSWLLRMRRGQADRCLMVTGGLTAIAIRISNTAEYGDYVRWPSLITAETSRRCAILVDISRRQLREEFVAECGAGNGDDRSPPA